ncbi:2Fe-2S iron-sulfur cluster-binding protein [Mangrovicoccus sp. HB161399]|uniref:2Fe-2S iron-sulfur cluster-binding protein n=1 Tax=Mangrovicoccus sp. HB161399 TaxID=2720392 RepID=UPI0015533606|nr:2Fe-2S iron-sulfur cluster-binding protein [Mangrovicoccus sp. HB161399]
MQITLTVNGETRDMDLDPRVTLLDALRDHLRLTGSKKGCDHGQCGACTVLMDGRRVNACLVLAAMAEGAEITTVEGLGRPGSLNPLQQEFVACDGFQCGYCTPGQIMSATGMLAEARDGWPSHVSESLAGPVALTDGEIAERMSGNLCRCAAYPGIRQAISNCAGTSAEAAKEAAE